MLQNGLTTISFTPDDYICNNCYKLHVAIQKTIHEEETLSDRALELLQQDLQTVILSSKLAWAMMYLSQDLAVPFFKAED